jgi:membrane protease subunit (stomatin/prohibitin family)
MGFVEKLRGELVDIIEWVDDSHHTLVWRFPRYHNQIKNGARLVVRPGQEALFVHQGRIADVFRPGTYTLETANLPILSTVQGWKHGFESPFKAEVYFVATRQITELKWGTPHPVMLRDADFGPVRLRAFGTYTLRTRNPKALLEQLVGTDAQFDAEEISVLLRSIISSCFADLLGRSGISVLDLASNYADLSETLRLAALERVDDEYGLDIPQLYIVNFSLPAEVERALDARSSLGILGDLDRYQQYQLGQSMPIAAENPAGGLAAAGVGLGMGMAYTGNLVSRPGGGGGHEGTGLSVVPRTPVARQTGWHVAREGKTFGPFTVTDLRDAVATGELTPASLVWSAGMEGWAEAREVAELATLFQPPPPPPAPHS